MEKYIRLLSILLDISGVVSAFDKNYVLAAALIILGLIFAIIASRESLQKEKEKTKQKELEEKQKTERVKIAEEEHTKRTKTAMSELTKQAKITRDIVLHSGASLPPDALQKQNNDNIIHINEIRKDVINDALHKKYMEDEKQKENESKYHEDERDILELATKFIPKLHEKKGETMETNISEL